jgi:hypothetical protein
MCIKGSDVCVVCGKKLTDLCRIPGTYQHEGYCGAGCAEAGGYVDPGVLYEAEVYDIASHGY